jgi:hypothetical protein
MLALKMVVRRSRAIPFMYVLAAPWLLTYRFCGCESFRLSFLFENKRRLRGRGRICPWRNLARKLQIPIY